jgi:hypothetical protein
MKLPAFALDLEGDLTCFDRIFGKNGTVLEFPGPALGAQHEIRTDDAPDGRTHNVNPGHVHV